MQTIDLKSKIGKVIYEEDIEKRIVISNNIWNYIGVKGVWVLLGKKLKSQYEFLNVGKSVDIGREILYDLACFHNLSIKTEGNSNYINQFGEYCGFNCDSGWTQEYLYPNIKNEYDKISFLFIHDESDAVFEKRLAWTTKARYWRNGKAYKTENPDNYKNNCDAYIGEGNKPLTEVKELSEIKVELAKYGFVFD